MKKIKKLVYGLPFIIDKIFGSSGYFKVQPGVLVDIEKISKQDFWIEYEELKRSANELLLNISNGETMHKKITVSKKFVNELIELINKKTDDGVHHLVKFNPLKCDVSYLFLTKFGDLPHRESQYWHHDSVGDRIKIFIDLGSNVSAPTVVDCEISNIEKGPQMFLNDRINYKPNVKNIKEFSPSMYKTIVAINTNWMHAGSNGPAGTTRSYLCIEISNIFKTLCRGRVGMRIKL